MKRPVGRAGGMVAPTVLAALLLAGLAGCAGPRAPRAERPALPATPGQHAVIAYDAAGRPLRFWLYLPAGSARAKDGGGLPLLLFLHGSGERGQDMARVKIHGPPKIVDGRPDFPFILVSPQLPAQEQWQPEALHGLLDLVLAGTPADPDRVYVTGLSLGGHGTWALAADRPQRFAAIAPISGRGDPASACRLKELPVWAFHGARDEIVPASGSTAMVEAVNVCGGQARLTLYPELGHDAWTATYDNPALYEWLLAHRRAAVPD